MKNDSLFHTAYQDNILQIQFLSCRCNFTPHTRIYYIPNIGSSDKIAFCRFLFLETHQNNKIPHIFRNMTRNIILKRNFPKLSPIYILYDVQWQSFNIYIYINGKYMKFNVAFDKTTR